MFTQLYNDRVSPPRWDFKMMFLRDIHKSSLSKFGDYRRNVYKTLHGDLEILLAEFINKGLIRESAFADCVDTYMTVKELKEYLKLKGFKSTGNKDILILRAVELFTNDERKKIEESESLYVLTPQGREVVNNDKERFLNELIHFENDIVEEIIMGEIEIACKRVSDFYALYPFPIGMGGDWSEGFHGKFREVVHYIMKSDYLTKGMNISGQLKNRIKAIISTNYLFQFASFSKASISGKLLIAYPDFKCEEIEEFLKDNPTGIFRDYNSEDPSHVAEIFNHTIVAYSNNQVDLKDVLQDNGKVNYKGVEILEGKNLFCKYCTKKQLKYEWGNLKSLPSLPIFPGCVCSYVHLFADE